MPNISNFMRDVYPALEMSIFEKHKQYPPVYPNVTNVKPTTRWYEETQTKVGLGLYAQTAEQQNYAKDEIKPGFYTRTQLLKFTKMFSVSEDLIKFGKYEGLPEYTQDRGRKAGITMDVFANAIYNNGFTALQSDGVPLFSLSHPGYVGSGTTFGNVLAVQASLSYVSLNAVLSSMSTQVDENGTLIYIRPRKLVYHPSNELIASEILKSTTRPDTANRADNVLRGMLGGIEPVPNPYLLSPSMWFVLADMHFVNCYTYKGLEIRPERDPYNGDHLVFGSFYMSTGVGSPMGVFAGSA